MEIYCKVTDAGLVPMYDSDLDEKKRLKKGEEVLCVIRRPRNYKFHKKFFALLRLTLDNLPERLERNLGITDEEDLLDSLKLDLGLARTVEIGGRRYIRTESISFGKMDETEFEKFYGRCTDIILKKYLRGTERAALNEEIERYF